MKLATLVFFVLTTLSLCYFAEEALAKTEIKSQSLFWFAPWRGLFTFNERQKEKNIVEVKTKTNNKQKKKRHVDGTANILNFQNLVSNVNMRDGSARKPNESANKGGVTILNKNATIDSVNEEVTTVNSKYVINNVDVVTRRMSNVNRSIASNINDTINSTTKTVDKTIIMENMKKLHIRKLGKPVGFKGRRLQPSLSKSEESSDYSDISIDSQQSLSDSNSDYSADYPKLETVTNPDSQRSNLTTIDSKESKHSNQVTGDLESDDSEESLKSIELPNSKPNGSDSTRNNHEESKSNQNPKLTTTSSSESLERQPPELKPQPQHTKPLKTNPSAPKPLPFESESQEFSLSQQTLDSDAEYIADDPHLEITTNQNSDSIVLGSDDSQDSASSKSKDSSDGTSSIDSFGDSSHSKKPNSPPSNLDYPDQLIILNINISKMKEPKTPSLKPPSDPYSSEGNSEEANSPLSSDPLESEELHTTSQNPAAPADSSIDSAADLLNLIILDINSPETKGPKTPCCYSPSDNQKPSPSAIKLLHCERVCKP